MARPDNKLTPKVHDELVKVIRSGNYIETACAYVGINKSTFYEWLKKGAREKDRVEKNPKARVKKELKKYVELSNSVEKALAQSEIRDVTLIGKAAETQWQAAAWRLERKFNSRWGRRDRHELEHSGGEKPIQMETKQEIDLSKLSDEELSVLESILDKSTDNGEAETGES